MLKLFQKLKTINKVSDSKQKGNDNTNRDLIDDLNEIQDRLVSVQSRYNLASDEDLLESLIYEENALRARYEYLIKKAKNNNVTSEVNLNV